jgi:hypothetical protein
MLVIWLYPSHAPATLLDGLLLQLKILLVQQRFEHFGKPSGVSLVPAPADYVRNGNASPARATSRLS